MNIEINGQVWEVPPEYRDKLIIQAWEYFIKEYDKLGDSMKIPAMMLTRKMLYDLEKDLTKKHGKELAVQIARPAKGGDPNKHLLWIMTGAIREGMRDATFSINTESSANTVDSFSVSLPRESDGRGSLADDGNVGERQNNGVETA